MQATSINTFLWCVYGLMVQPINKVQIIAISTLSNLIAELSFRTMWHVTRHVARDKRSMCCYVICTRLCPGHLSERVRDSSRRSEEIVEKKSRTAPFKAIIIIIITITIIITIIIGVRIVCTAVFNRLTARIYFPCYPLNGPARWEQQGRESELTR